jgi:hypothetical protein
MLPALHDRGGCPVLGGSKSSAIMRRLLAADRGLVRDDRVELEFDQPFRVDEP